MSLNNVAITAGTQTLNNNLNISGNFNIPGTITGAYNIYIDK